MNEMIILLCTFMMCSAFLWRFSKRAAIRNKEFYVTLLMWLVLVYECIRYQFPETLTLPQPYRRYQHRAETLLLAIYGWEAVNYVVEKFLGKCKIRDLA